MHTATSVASVLAASLLICPAACHGEEQGDITITIPEAIVHTFHGFGASQKEGWSHSYIALGEQRRGRIADMIWKDAGFTTMRIWFTMKHYAPEPGARDLDKVFSQSLATQVREAQARGMRHLLVAPCGVPRYMQQRKEYRKRDGKTGYSTDLKDEAIEQHAQVIADFVAQVRDTYDIHFEATGVQNEPNTGHDCHFTAARMVRSVKALRAALDRHGLETVKVIAPETASADRVAYEMVDALKADPDAWDALGGIATHSYNMAATARLAKAVQGTGKEYWQTESSCPGRESAGDIRRAATMGATVLSDLNRHVTHWIHFIGYAHYDPRDNGTRIIGFTHKETSGEWYTVFHKYYYFKQLAQTFAPGVVMRGPGSSSLDRSMTWTYGRKPRVIAAAGVNPDGSWGVGVINYTSDDFPMKSGFQKANAGRPAQTFDATIEIEGLRDVAETTFHVVRSGKAGVLKQEDDIVGRNGRIELVLEPFDLVTLRSHLDEPEPRQETTAPRREPSEIHAAPEPVEEQPVSKKTPPATQPDPGIGALPVSKPDTSRMPIALIAAGALLLSVLAILLTRRPRRTRRR